MHKFGPNLSSKWSIRKPELIAGCWNNEEFILCHPENPLATDVYVDVAIEHNTHNYSVIRYFVNADGWVRVNRKVFSNVFDLFWRWTDIPVSVEQYRQIVRTFNENGQPLLELVAY